MDHLGSDLQQQLQSARNELVVKKQELQQYQEKIEVMKSDFCAQKCSISLRYLEQLQAKDQEHKAEDQSLMLEKDAQICQLEAEKQDLQKTHDHLRAECNHYLVQYQVVVTDKNFLESDVHQLRKENSNLKDRLNWWLTIFYLKLSYRQLPSMFRSSILLQLRLLN